MGKYRNKSALDDSLWHVQVGDGLGGYFTIAKLRDNQSSMEIKSNGILPTTKDEGPLCTRPPTRQELIEHYPAKFSWEDLKTFVNSG